MMSSQHSKKITSIKIKVVKCAKNGCRKRHVSIHNPNLEIYYCENCKANVTATEKLVCNCCGKEVPKMVKNNFARLEKVLNKAQREYGQLADDWASFPTKKPVTLEIGLGSQVCSRLLCSKWLQVTVFLMCMSHSQIAGDPDPDDLILGWWFWPA